MFRMTGSEIRFHGLFMFRMTGSEILVIRSYLTLILYRNNRELSRLYQILTLCIAIYAVILIIDLSYYSIYYTRSEGIVGIFMIIPIQIIFYITFVVDE